MLNHFQDVVTIKRKLNENKINEIYKDFNSMAIESAN